ARWVDRCRRPTPDGECLTTGKAPARSAMLLLTRYKSLVLLPLQEVLHDLGADAALEADHLAARADADGLHDVGERAQLLPLARNQQTGGRRAVEPPPGAVLARAAVLARPGPPPQSQVDALAKGEPPADRLDAGQQVRRHLRQAVQPALEGAAH